MTGLKNPLYACVFLLAACFFFVSCGVGTSVDPPAGNRENSPLTPEKIDPETLNPEKLNPEKISRLESELSAAGQVQKNLNKDIKDKTATIKKLQDTIVTLEEKISVLEKKTITDRALPPSVLYKKARNLFIEDTYTRAASLFAQFEKKYPEHDLADNAVYWLGECHYSMAEHEKAVIIFNRLTTQYPKSEKVPDALLKTGYSYLLLDDANRAHHYLKQVLKKYPFSPAAEKAQEKLKGFK